MNEEIIAKDWEKSFLDYFNATSLTDASHDLGHFRRVFNNAKLIAMHEDTDIDYLILMAAAYFHDVVNLPKNHPERMMGSRYSALKAKEILLEMQFPHEKIPHVCHAIETHSFSAQIQPETIEAKIIQDADRVESLGAMGIIRTFYVSGRLQRAPYDREDLHAERRPLDDKIFGLDHFYCKLFKLQDLLQTQGGHKIASKRTQFLHTFVKELTTDIKKNNGGALALVWACYKAGQQSTQLFDLADPLALKRALNPDYFVLDELMGLGDQFPEFIQSFLSQFKEEVEPTKLQESHHE